MKMNQNTHLELSKKNRAYLDFPCLSEKELVDQCYIRTNYNRDSCFKEIENYKACKQFWGKVEKARRGAGIKPAKPDDEERKKIKEYYLEHRKLPKFIPEPATK